MTQLRFSGSSLLIITSVALMAMPAMAQTTQVSGSVAAPAPAQTDAASAAGPSLSEIVVTAQRRSEHLQDVPISIQNLTSQALNDANIQNIQEIGKITPSLRFDNQGAFVQPTIRGIGTSVVTSGSGSNVGIYIDGFYSPNPIAADFDLLNVENVQVLKGPQGTLFGRNTTGGAILVTTTKPSFDTAGTLDLSYGSFNAQRYQGYFTTGLSDKVAFDIGGQVSRGDGYIHNAVTGASNDGAYANWQIRTGLRFDVSPDVSVLLRYQHIQTDDPFTQLTSDYVSNGQPVYDGNSTITGTEAKSVGQPLSSAVLLAPLYGTTPVYGTQPGQTAITDPVFVHAHNDIIQLTPTFDLGFGTLTSYTQYRVEWSDQQQSLYNAAPNPALIQVPILDHTFSQEFLLSSKSGNRLQWTTGVFFLDYTDRFRALVEPIGSTFSQVAGSNSDTRSTAVFLDATYQLLDKLFLTAGGRYSHDQVGDPFYEYVTGTGALGRVYAPTLTNNKFTPRAVLRFAPDRETSIYASYSQGFKAGIYNLGGQSTTAVQPEQLNAYEIGFKRAERNFSLNLASFYYNYKNLQVSSYGITAGGVPVGYITNAANARIYGAEAQMHYNVTPDFQVDASGGYLNAKYQHYINDPAFKVCTADIGTCGGDVLVNAIIPDGKDLTMQRAPKWTATASARYGLDAFAGRLVLSGNLSYSSKVFFDPANQFSQNQYATLGLRAEWTNPSKKITLAIYGDNVTDKRYYLVVTPENTSAVASWSPPATIGGEVRLRFP